MMFKKTFINTICITLMVTLLTISVGRVTRVSAIGTTIAAAGGAALLSVGIVYCSYMALTGASVHVPDAVDNLTSWLSNLGSKVVQYPAGRAAYDELYTDYLSLGSEPAQGFLDRAWTWTSDKLKSWANDFSSTDVMQDICSYTYSDTLTPTNNFDYSFEFYRVSSNVKVNGVVRPLSYYPDLTFYTGPQIILINWDDSSQSYMATTAPLNLPYEVRNVLKPNGYYGYEAFIDGQWTTFRTSNYDFGGRLTDRLYIQPGTYAQDYWQAAESPRVIDYGQDRDYPIFPYEVVYDQANDSYWDMQSTDVTVRTPQWPVLPPDDRNLPVIPYVQLPYDPNFIDPLTGVHGGGNWGFNLSDLLDELAALGETLFELRVLADLINSFRDAHSGDTYIFYDDDVTGDTYYQYYYDYSTTNYNDYSVTNYNIDVSDVDEHLPVDLNTISLYTNNTYIDTVKSSAQNGSTILRDFFVFWHDVDSELVYVLFGCAIVTLVGAFIGKWGHS